MTLVGLGKSALAVSKANSSVFCPPKQGNISVFHPQNPLSLRGIEGREKLEK